MAAAALHPPLMGLATPRRRGRTRARVSRRGGGAAGPRRHRGRLRALPAKARAPSGASAPSGCARGSRGQPRCRSARAW
eukprot:8901645-Alexandrium_andersonii.AAC.1